MSRVDDKIRSCQLPEIKKKKNLHEEQVLKMQREKELKLHKQPKKEFIVRPYGRLENSSENFGLNERRNELPESSQPNCEDAISEKGQVAKENTESLAQREDVASVQEPENVKSKW